MTTVTGFFEVTLNGARVEHTFTDMPYAEFWVHQRNVLRALNMTSDWGLDQILGVPSTFTGLLTGDVGYRYEVDFKDGGGNSHGENFWHGVPEDAAIEIARMLNAAFA